MSTTAETGRLWYSYAAGEPRPLIVASQGLQYLGETVRLDRWDPAWGWTLDGDLYFRIVLLRNRRPVPLSDIQDSRIAVCIPGRRLSKGYANVGKELTAVRETQALYLTQRDPKTAYIRNYLETQREELEGRMISEEMSRYASGHIESHAVLSEDIGEFFSDSEPVAWLHKLADALLCWAYPSLPLESALLPRPLAPEDIFRIYEAIFSSDPEGRSPLGEFGPCLGLSKVHEALTFDPEECRVFQQIRAELESRGGELPWEEVHHLLAHASGLTQPLATLYLLAFVYYGHPEAELGLASDHHLTFRDGRLIRGTRLTRESVPFLPWPWQDEPSVPGHQGWSAFAREIVDLRLPREEVSWNDALQYTSILCQGLTEIEEGSADVLKQERELFDALHELDRDAAQARDALENLSGAVPSPNKEQLQSTIGRLSEVCEGGDFREVYHRARAAFGNPQVLLEHIDLLRRLLYLGECLEDVENMKTYLDMAVVQSGYSQLSIDQTALLEEMTLPVLLFSEQGWPTVRGHIREYQARYRRAYAEHHTSYQREASRLLTSLEDSQLELRAITLLNSIPELGEPVGTELPQRYNDLEQGIWLCNLNPWDLSLLVNPRCPNCQMALGEPAPTRDIQAFQRDLDRALREQNRRLSLALVERILHNRLDERLENFLKIVQASDLSALSNTLNDELALYIRGLLRDP